MIPDASTAKPKKTTVKASALVELSAGPFVRWVGSKRALAGELLARVPEHILHYHEPFVGAGWLFWTLANAGRLKKNYVSLSDTCDPLVRTWRGIKDDVDAVVTTLASYPINAEHYYEVRAVDPQQLESDAAVAAWFIYLNKTCVNGIWRVNQKGAMNVPWGRWAEHNRPMPRVLNEPVLRAASAMLQKLRVSITARPFETVLNYARPGDLVYCDPPYVPVSGTSDFTSYTKGGFTRDDHVRLRDVAKELKGRGVHVMLSNADVPMVRELYARGFKVDEVMAPRAVNSKGDGRSKVREVIIT